MDGMAAVSSPSARSGVRSGGRRKILVVGNSHTQIIKEAIAIRASAGMPVADDVEVCWLNLGHKSNFGDTPREDAIAKVRSLRSSDLLVMSLIGTLHNSIGLFDHEIPFSLALSIYDPLETSLGRQIIPRNVMSDVFKDYVERVPVFEQLAEAARCLVVHFIPPPPKEGFAESGKTRIVDEVQVQLEYAPKHSRLALWKLEESVVANYLSKLTVYHYAVPLNAATPEGFLLPAYHSSDATHANAQFGELLLRDFERMLHGLPRNP